GRRDHGRACGNREGSRDGTQSCSKNHHGTPSFRVSPFQLFNMGGNEMPDPGFIPGATLIKNVARRKDTPGRSNQFGLPGKTKNEPAAWPK
ncbi:MAG: hypothetical protein RLO21_18445, partial [Nitratireductor sp.]